MFCLKSPLAPRLFPCLLLETAKRAVTYGMNETRREPPHQPLYRRPDRESTAVWSLQAETLLSGFWSGYTTFGQRMKTKHIGLSIFSVCVLLLIKSERFARSLSEEKKAEIESRDWMGLIHGARYYIAGVGLLGLGIFAEDKVSSWMRDRRRFQGIIPRSKIGFLESNDGTVVQDPSYADLRDAAIALFTKARNFESWFATGTGWSIRASSNGRAVLQNVSAGFGPWYLEKQSVTDISNLWILLHEGRISEIRDRPWKLVFK